MEYIASYVPKIPEILDSPNIIAVAFVLGCLIIGFAIFRTKRLESIRSLGDGGGMSPEEFALANKKEDRLLHKQQLREQKLVAGHSAAGEKWSHENDDLEMGYLTAQFQRNPTKEHALLLLTSRRKEGVAMRNEAYGIASTAHLDQWVRRTSEWREATINALSAVDRVDARWFEILDIVPPPRVPLRTVLNDETYRSVLLSQYQQLDCRLDRLDRILRKHGVGVD